MKTLSGKARSAQILFPPGLCASTGADLCHPQVWKYWFDLFLFQCCPEGSASSMEQVIFLKGLSLPGDAFV